jgi:hypothetical protein
MKPSRQQPRNRFGFYVVGAPCNELGDNCLSHRCLQCLGAAGDDREGGGFAQRPSYFMGLAY